MRLQLLQKIQSREEKDPDQVDKMPEEARMLNPIDEPLRVRLIELRAGTPEIRVHRHPTDDVKHVQTGEREIDREEVAGARKQPGLELVAVFEILDDEENAAEQDRRSHVEAIGPETVPHQRRP